MAGTPPKRVNASGEREVTEYAVKNADDPVVERAQLNRILKALQARLVEVETNGGGGDDDGTTVHGELAGLDSDDHTQYLNETRAFAWLESVLVPQSGVDIEYDASAQTADLYILTTTGTAGEALSAGDKVSIDASGEIVLADASTNNLLCAGFVLDDYLAAATDVRVYYGGENNALSGLTPGDQYYLSDTVPGGVTDTPPTGNSPKVIQQLGIAKSATSLLVNIQQAIELPV